MYFLQRDDIMLHFTLTGSSDITDCQCLLLVYFFVYLESVAGFKFGYKLGFEFGLKLNLNWKVSKKCVFKTMFRFPLTT